MGYLNIFLSAILIGCALLVVRSTDQRRQFFIELQNIQSKEYQLYHDYMFLQYRQGLLLKPYRIDKLARQLLKMQSISIDRTQYIIQILNNEKTIDTSTSVEVKTYKKDNNTKF
ncbi:MAG: cell division protein FtsL [Burkholderia sp.]|nr:cell division protein FtsL [Burkholderia sp.]